VSAAGIVFRQGEDTNVVLKKFKNKDNQIATFAAFGIFCSRAVVARASLEEMKLAFSPCSIYIISLG
jgi:hypothetical protein